MPREVNTNRDPGSGVRDPMSRVRDDDVLAEVDRELRAGLSVTPSADFEARVLRRIDEERVESRSYYPWLAAAAALLLAAGWLYWVNRAPGIDGTPPPQLAQRGPDVPLPPITGPNMPTYEGPAKQRAGRGSLPRRAAARSTQPDVIVPLNQMEALRRLVVAVNEGRIEAPPDPSPEPPAAPMELTVPPLVVEPIPVPALEPGTQQRSPDSGRSD